MTDTDIRSQPFSLSQADYIAYYKATYFRTFGILPWGPTNWLFLVAMPGYAAYTTLMDGAQIIGAVILLITLLLWTVAMPALGAAATRYSFAHTPFARTSMIASASNAAFTLEGPDICVRRRWRGMRGATVMGDLICLTDAAATLVPRSAFATPEAFDAFTEACKRHITDARADAEPVPDFAATTPRPGALASLPYTLGKRPSAVQALTLFLEGLRNPSVWLALGLGTLGTAAALYMEGVASFGAALALAVPSILVFAGLMTVCAWQGIRQRPSSRAMRRLTIDEHRLRSEDEGVDFAIAWPLVRHIDRRFGVLRFRLTPSRALFVPLSAFPSRDAAKAFHDQALAWWQAAKHRP